MTATVLRDSVSPAGARLTTMQVKFHRFALAEFNTHRVFSRNSASSRAIPVAKQLAQVRENPAMPVSWPLEQSGMQGGDELDGHERWAVKQYWLDAARHAANTAELLTELGLHKSVTNRILEPFMWHTVIVSSTDWDGFFEQRCSPLAQPEIRVAAEAMREAYEASTPTLLKHGEWHTPLIQPDEDDFTLMLASEDYWKAQGEGLVTRQRATELSLETRKRVSAARCARVSYLTHDGKRDIEADLKLYARLVEAKPGHWSPLEHVATPCVSIVDVSQYGQRLYTECARGHSGNFNGWEQLRHRIEHQNAL